MSQSGSLKGSGGGGTGLLSEYFSTYLSTTQTNATGDGTVFGIPFDVILANSSGSLVGGTYTAPATGLYFFSTTVALVTAAQNVTDYILIFDGDWSTEAMRLPINLSGDEGSMTLTGSQLVSMTAGDVMKISILCAGGSKQVSVQGNNPESGLGSYKQATLFSGYRIA